MQPWVTAVNPSIVVEAKMTEDPMKKAKMIPESDEEVVYLDIAHPLDHMDLLERQKELLLIPVREEDGGRLVEGVEGVVVNHLCE